MFYPEIGWEWYWKIISISVINNDFFIMKSLSFSASIAFLPYGSEYLCWTLNFICLWWYSCPKVSTLFCRQFCTGSPKSGLVWASGLFWVMLCTHTYLVICLRLFYRSVIWSLTACLFLILVKLRVEVIQLQLASF